MMKTYLGFPFLGQSVADIDHTSIKIRLRGQSRSIEPSVPVDGFKRFRGFLVRSEEIEEGGFELE